MTFDSFLANELKRNLREQDSPSAQNFTSPTGGAYSIRLTDDQLVTWARGWPLSNVHDYRAIEADFEKNGDMADIRCYIPQQYGLPNPNTYALRNSRIDDQETECSMDFLSDNESVAMTQSMQCGAALAGLVPDEHCDEYWDLATRPDPIVNVIPHSGAIRVSGDCGSTVYYDYTKKEALTKYNRECV